MLYGKSMASSPPGLCLGVRVVTTGGRRHSFAVLGLDLLDEVNRADGKFTPTLDMPGTSPGGLSRCGRPSEC